MAIKGVALLFFSRCAMVICERFVEFEGLVEDLEVLQPLEFHIFFVLGERGTGRSTWKLISTESVTATGCPSYCACSNRY